ncbi:MAG: hypothetical protein H0U27_01455 [Nitrosopumilus sp.]|nr:hypothetical protein [Nitrosopumilus sp.]
MKILLILFTSLFYYCSNAQTEKTYVIKAGQEIGDVLSFSDIYQYPNFKLGTVEFYDGKKSNARLNYNYLNGEIDFISSNGDTLSLDDEYTIKIIKIEKDTFYYSDGYLKEIESFDTRKLAVKRKLIIVKMQKLGAFDQPSNAAVDSYGGYSDKRSVKLVVKEDITLALVSSYYINDRQKFMPVNKKNILKVFYKKEKEISRYINEQNINFKKEDDVIKLFEYLKNMES